jgi:hypothetical protein
MGLEKKCCVMVLELLVCKKAEPQLQLSAPLDIPPRGVPCCDQTGLLCGVVHRSTCSVLYRFDNWQQPGLCVGLAVGDGRGSAWTRWVGCQWDSWYFTTQCCKLIWLWRWKCLSLFTNHYQAPTKEIQGVQPVGRSEMTTLHPRQYSSTEPCRTTT